MRKQLVMAALIVAICVAMGAGYRPWTEKQTAAHEAAEILRQAGVEEDHETIKALQEMWWADYTEVESDDGNGATDLGGSGDHDSGNGAGIGGDVPGLAGQAAGEVDAVEAPIYEAAGITWEDYCTMCYTNYREAGPGCSEAHQRDQAAVIWNRVKSDLFPDTVIEVICQPRQFSPSYVRSSLDGIPAENIAAVDAVLSGEWVTPPDVVWQAQFVQGSYVYATHEVSLPGWHSITYICGG